ncbi:uncharacterized protein Gasu_12510 [Galdieria sulphuraria]|uniref:Uncharacterized protein n=1 Tax=Galdieria sulphuraria TaxID=130081 RepID=M2X522_GALSU|nr:uncharacterized protein Gasu_12510 [Galdieria sulphuraria]EME31580.1 hypothetical protein Gasu_12510 [Galdieria sulphuraria]|eukprot:XP_005708100.1 hypothetical protein Gasu_12510 [Galdieria sulphuraria]
MKNFGWMLLNVAILVSFLYLDLAVAERKPTSQNRRFVLHFEQRNCSKNGTKEYIASENICVCKTGWETAIDQNPSTRVYCNIYVGSSTNNSSGTSTSSSTTTTEYSIIIIIVIVIIIGVCVCCCCRRPLMQCMQDCCCGCADSISWSSNGAHRETCKTCNSYHEHARAPCSSHFHNPFVSAHDCMHWQTSAQPVYIQQPPSVWMPPSVVSPSLQHTNGVLVSNGHQDMFQGNIRTPPYNEISATKGKWNQRKHKTIDASVPFTILPIQHISKRKIMPVSYSDVTSVESETQISNPSQVSVCNDTNFQDSSLNKRVKKGRHSHKHRHRDRKT